MAELLYPLLYLDESVVEGVEVDFLCCGGGVDAPHDRVPLHTRPARCPPIAL